MAKATPGMSIEQLRRRFERWRNSRSRTAAIPEELWTGAIEAARQEGVNRTARALRLDGGKLKRLLVAADAGAKRRHPSPPTFVELIAPPSAGPAGCVIEFESQSGSKMRIQWKATVPPDWADLLRAWRDAER
jgi:hypothetical protein